VIIVVDLQKKSFYVVYEIWDTSEWCYRGAASWQLVGTNWQTTGSLSDARKLASARLVEFESQLD
jgi:hypothetical protein